jgi:2-phosphosulfolactate phosphatase
VHLDVLLLPSQITPADTAGRVVAVIDVLRASSSIARALASGAKAVIPFVESDEAVISSKQFDRSEVRLAGERKMRRIEGFDLGNSPREFSPLAVRGKTVLISTSNGSRALIGVQGARDIIVASYVNCSAAVALLRTAVRSNTDVALICAGTDGRFALEDAACAGRLVQALIQGLENIELNDAARACSLIDKQYGDDLHQLFLAASHGRALAEAGYTEDLADCAAVDSCPVVPVYQERQITLLGPDRAR